MPGRGQNRSGQQDRTWTHGERDSTRHNRKRSLPLARLDDPSADELRECIEEQRCWWCGREGFAILANHTNQAHGISAARLRELACLFKHTPICSPVLSQVWAQRPSAAENIKRAQQVPRAKKHVLSAAGLAAQRQRLREHWNRIGVAAAQAQRKSAGAVMAARAASRRARCTNCGGQTPPQRKTCSAACRLEVRRRTALAVNDTRYGR